MQDTEIVRYPLKSVFVAFSILRNYTTGGGAIPISPNKIKVSPQFHELQFESPDGQVVSIVTNRGNDGLHLAILSSLTRLKSEVSNEQFLSFEWRYVGFKSPGSRSGEFYTLSNKQIAQVFGRSIRTIQSWNQKNRDRFDEILVDRKLLPPKEKY